MIKLYEQIIGSVSDEIKVTIEIDKSRHAGQRQSRNADEFISNEDIKTGVQDAVKALATNLMLDKIDIGSYVCIVNKKFNPELNIIGTIKQGNNQLQFIIVTIMKKNNFYVKNGTYKLEIN